MKTTIYSLIITGLLILSGCSGQNVTGSDSSTNHPEKAEKAKPGK